MPKYRNDSGKTLKVTNTETGARCSVGPGVILEGEGWRKAAEQGLLKVIEDAGFLAGTGHPAARPLAGTTTDKIAGLDDQDGERTRASGASSDPTPDVGGADPATLDVELLPPGWTELIQEKTGKPYYHHAESNITQWGDPREQVEDLPDPEPQDDDQDEDQPPPLELGDGFDPNMTPEARLEHIKSLTQIDNLKELYLIRDFLEQYEPQSDHIVVCSEMIQRLGADEHA